MLQLAELSDLSAVVHLTACCIAEMRAHGIDQWDEVYPSRATHEEDIREKHLYLLRDGELVGSIVLNAVESPEYSSVRWAYEGVSVGVIHRLMVHPSYQGRGYAKKIVRAAELLAMERGVAAVRLDAYAGNEAALRLYRSLGYRVAGEVVFRKGKFICYEKQLAGDRA